MTPHPYRSSNARRDRASTRHRALRLLSTLAIGLGVACDSSSYDAMQARGADPRGMGVDQYTSTHQFDTLPDGGRIVLVRDTSDTAGVAQVRLHLESIVQAFSHGDFSTPAFVHMQHVPGTAVMAAHSSALRYAYTPLPGGGAVRITAERSDTTVVRAVHDFIMFQRAEHHAGGH